MRNSLLPDERQLINATLAFANLPGITSVTAVEQLFRRYYIGLLKRGEESTREVDRLERLRHQVSSWLRRIEDRRPHKKRSGPARYRPVAEEIGELLWRRKVSVSMELVEARPGQFSLIDRFEGGDGFEPIEAACLRAVALIFARGLITRLHECPWCKKFHVAMDRRRKFCKVEHAKQYDAADSKRRVKELRDRKKQMRETAKAQQEAGAIAARRARRKASGI